MLLVLLRSAPGPLGDSCASSDPSRREASSDRPASADQWQLTSGADSEGVAELGPASDDAEAEAEPRRAVPAPLVRDKLSPPGVERRDET